MQYMKLDNIQRNELMASLAAVSRYLRQTLGSLSPEEALTQGPKGEFAPVEQVWHLADLEREGFGLRMRRLREEVNPHLPDFDGTKIEQERNYRALSLDEGLREFEAAREANIKFLLSLDADAWNRSGTQEGVGEVSMCDMPVFLQQHDESHIAEIRDWQQRIGR